MRRIRPLLRTLCAVVAVVVVTGLVNAVTAVPATAAPALPTVSVGGSFACALSASGLASCWGQNAYGQLGDGTTFSHFAPAAVTQPAAFSKLTLGSNFACALTDAGQVYCWGENASGQLGDGTTNNRSTPTLVPQVNGAYATVEAGEYHACALDGTGLQYCWGKNQYGRLGDGTTTDRSLPTAVQQGAVRFTAIAPGDLFSCALTSDGLEYCWGQNNNARSNLLVGNSPTPRLTEQGSNRFTALSSGGFGGCGKNGLGAVFCWGYGDLGATGDGYLYSHNLANALSGGPYTQVATGTGVTCVLSSDGKVRCFGMAGRVGDGTNTQANAPTLISQGALSFASIGESWGNSMCAVEATAGDIYCWGSNGSGQFGNLSTTSALVPTRSWYSVPVSTSTVSVAVDPALSFSIAGEAGSCAGATPTAGTSSTATSVNLGRPTAGTAAVAAQRFDVSTNAATGFQILGRYGGSLAGPAGATIPDVAAIGWSNAQPFPALGTAAFGVRAGWTSAGNWFRFTTTNSDNFMSAFVPAAHTQCVAYRVQTASDTPAGSYATSVTYTAVARF